jgi:serine/threonine protein kinase
MHDLGVVHGNLEAVSGCTLLYACHMLTVTLYKANVFVDSEGIPRIGGLGSAFVQSSPPTGLEDFHGSTPCSAPELVDPETFGFSKAQPTKASDVFALGVLIHQVKHASALIPIQSAQNAGCRFLRMVTCSPT